MSLPAAPPLWTPAQQSWLQAMGYTVFVDGTVDVAPDAPVALSAVPAHTEAAPAAGRQPDAIPRRTAPPPEDTRPSPRSPDPAPAPARPSAPERRAVPAGDDAPAPARPGTRRPAVRMPPPLQIALLRASGCNPNEAETQALMASWDLDALRGNAAAKRALWPQLRALRKRNRS